MTGPVWLVSGVLNVAIKNAYLSEELLELFGSNNFGIRLKRRLVQCVLQEFGHLEANLNKLALFFFL